MIETLSNFVLVSAVAYGVSILVTGTVAQQITKARKMQNPHWIAKTQPLLWGLMSNILAALLFGWWSL